MFANINPLKVAGQGRADRNEFSIKQVIRVNSTSARFTARNDPMTLFNEVMSITCVPHFYTTRPPHGLPMTAHGCPFRSLISIDCPDNPTPCM